MMHLLSHPADLSLPEPKYGPNTMNWYEMIKSMTDRFGMGYVAAMPIRTWMTCIRFNNTPSADAFMKISIEPVVTAMVSSTRSRHFP